MKARLPQGMGGGPQNMNAMLKQARKMQEDMERVQAEVESREFSATSGGGAVEVKMNGKKEVTKITLKPEVVDPDDIEMLEDLITAALNQVIAEVETTTSSEMQKVTGSISMPGMF